MNSPNKQLPSGPMPQNNNASIRDQNTNSDASGNASSNVDTGMNFQDLSSTPFATSHSFGLNSFLRHDSGQAFNSLYFPQNGAGALHPGSGVAEFDFTNGLGLGQGDRLSQQNLSHQRFTLPSNVEIFPNPFTTPDSCISPPTHSASAAVEFYAALNPNALADPQLRFPPVPLPPMPVPMQLDSSFPDWNFPPYTLNTPHVGASTGRLYTPFPSPAVPIASTSRNTLSTSPLQPLPNGQQQTSVGPIRTNVSQRRGGRTVVKSPISKSSVGARCDECGTVITHAKDMARHKKGHLPEEEKKKELKYCMFCDHATMQQSNLDRHINSVHLKLRENRCKFPGCSATYGDPSGLNKHQKTVHGVGPRRKRALAALDKFVKDEITNATDPETCGSGVNVTGGSRVVAIPGPGPSRVKVKAKATRKSVGAVTTKKERADKKENKGRKETAKGVRKEGGTGIRANVSVPASVAKASSPETASAQPLVGPLSLPPSAPVRAPSTNVVPAVKTEDIIAIEEPSEPAANTTVHVQPNLDNHSNDTSRPICCPTQVVQPIPSTTSENSVETPSPHHVKSIQCKPPTSPLSIPIVPPQVPTVPGISNTYTTATRWHNLRTRNRESREDRHCRELEERIGMRQRQPTLGPCAGPSGVTGYGFLRGRPLHPSVLQSVTMKGEERENVVSEKEDAKDVEEQAQGRTLAPSAPPSATRSNFGDVTNAPNSRTVTEAGAESGTGVGANHYPNANYGAQPSTHTQIQPRNLNYNIPPADYARFAVTSDQFSTGFFSVLAPFSRGLPPFPGSTLRSDSVANLDDMTMRAFAENTHFINSNTGVSVAAAGMSGVESTPAQRVEAARRGGNYEGAFPLGN